MKNFYCHILTRNQKKDNFKDFTVALYIISIQFYLWLWLIKLLTRDIFIVVTSPSDVVFGWTNANSRSYDQWQWKKCWQYAQNQHGNNPEKHEKNVYLFSWEVFPFFWGIFQKILTCNLMVYGLQLNQHHQQFQKQVQSKFQSLHYELPNYLLVN